jgi:hypothetical protein
MQTLLQIFGSQGSVPHEILEFLDVMPNTEAGGYSSPTAGGVNVILSANGFTLDYLDGIEIEYRLVDGDWYPVWGMHYSNGYPDRDPQVRYMFQGTWGDWKAV